ncbi:hypothetical protein GGR58DRAFT_426674 [Xylaria digitata]|nr:hypothetical protein GGR58DRAFT_426674 [Xylaria digitata]
MTLNFFFIVLGSITQQSQQNTPVLEPTPDTATMRRIMRCFLFHTDLTQTPHLAYSTNHASIVQSRRFSQQWDTKSKKKSRDNEMYQ